ncbi:MAG: citrate synthase [Acidobacteriota bacterium]
MPDSLSVKDNRTGKSFELPIEDGTIRTADLRQLKASDDDFGIMGYDPAYLNTASCRSSITYIDGDKGILRYRGYGIEELAEKSNYLETAYLLLKGELPTKAQYEAFKKEITLHTLLHENVKKFMDGFTHDAPPMTMLLSTVGALRAFYPEATNILSPENRAAQIIRLMAKMPTLAAFAYRHSVGMRYVYPDNDLSYTGNFLSMMFRMAERSYQPNPVFERALDVLFILHADHEQNCSTAVMRSTGSSHVDAYSSAAAAIAALYGPLHGGANAAVLKMLQEIGSRDKIPAYVASVKEGKGRLMGFGHRVYKSYDPRAKIIRQMAHDVFAVTGVNPLLETALELERIALQDEYFIKRKLYPNVDFYTGLIYQAIGFPVDMFPVLFAIPRMSGWLAQWQEMLTDAEQKIARPRQIYVGKDLRSLVPMEQR